MSRADVVGLAMAGVLAIVALVLMAGCAPDERPTTCIYGSIDAATHRAIADMLDRLPADPYRCVKSIHLGESCPGTHGCYYPDEHAIYASPEALPHELAHAAAECAFGDPDYDHAAEFWRAR